MSFESSSLSYKPQCDPNFSRLLNNLLSDKEDCFPGHSSPLYESEDPRLPRMHSQNSSLNRLPITNLELIRLIQEKDLQLKMMNERLMAETSLRKEENPPVLLPKPLVQPTQTIQGAPADRESSIESYLVRDCPQTLSPSSSNPFRDLSPGFEAPTSPVAYATSNPDETFSKKVSESDGLIVCGLPLGEKNISFPIARPIVQPISPTNTRNENSSFLRRPVLSQKRGDYPSEQSPLSAQNPHLIELAQVRLHLLNRHQDEILRIKKIENFLKTVDYQITKRNPPSSSSMAAHSVRPTVPQEMSKSLDPQEGSGDQSSPIPDWLKSGEDFSSSKIRPVPAKNKQKRGLVESEMRMYEFYRCEKTPLTDRQRAESKLKYSLLKNVPEKRRKRMRKSILEQERRYRQKNKKIEIMDGFERLKEKYIELETRLAQCQCLNVQKPGRIQLNQCFETS